MASFLMFMKSRFQRTDHVVIFLFFFRFVFHYVVCDKLAYIVMADADFPRLISFQFLEDVKNRFVALYGSRSQTASALAYNTDFQGTLSEQLKVYNARGGDTNVNKEKIQKVQQHIAQVKDVVVENIDRVIAQGEGIELLVDKTEDLNQHSFKFKTGSQGLVRSMWWKNVKLYVIGAIALIVIIYFLIAIVCGFDLKC
jgi:vesicle-associated membrane protein 7